MTAARLFSADELARLLVELGERIGRRGESVDAYVIGGAAMAIGLGSRRATEDIDGLFRPFVDLTFDVFGEDGVTLTDSRESVLFQAEEMIRLSHRA